MHSTASSPAENPANSTHMWGSWGELCMVSVQAAHTNPAAHRWSTGWSLTFRKAISSPAERPPKQAKAPEEARAWAQWAR